jgi:hypothetical protein
MMSVFAAPNNSIIPHTPAPTVPCIGLSSLRNATGDFSDSNIIGRGGFGIVYEVCTSNCSFQIYHPLDCITVNQSTYHFVYHSWASNAHTETTFIPKCYVIKIFEYI